MDPRRLLPALAALACVCVVATLVVTLAGLGERSPRETQSTPAGAIAKRSAAGSIDVGPSRILAGWDERRSVAWAEGDTAALRDLYADGSRAGAADVRLLRAYLRRGLTVEGLRTQVLALEVLERSPGRVVLGVTDRVVGARAAGGASSVALPADRASARRIVLVRQGQEWLVAEARDQASAAASTSRTSSSSKS